MEISNPRIIDFFKSHPTLNPENILLQFIDFYEHNFAIANGSKDNMSKEHIIIESLQHKLNNIFFIKLLLKP